MEFSEFYDRDIDFYRLSYNNQLISFFLALEFVLLRVRTDAGKIFDLNSVFNRTQTQPGRADPEQRNA